MEKYSVILRKLDFKTLDSFRLTFTETSQELHKNFIYIDIVSYWTLNGLILHGDSKERRGSK